MPRGEVSPVGTRRVTQNGYWTTKTENGWRPDHHLIAEKVLGRLLEPTERVYFEDGNKMNLDPDNIAVEKIKRRSSQIFMLEKKVTKLQEELDLVKDELESLRSSE